MSDYGLLARALADAATSVDGVLGLHAGRYGEVATYLPGGTLEGVRVCPDLVEIQLIVELRADIRGIAEQVRLLAEEISGMPAVVTVADVAERVL